MESLVEEKGDIMLVEDNSINDEPFSVNKNSSGSVVSGYINNRADDSFINVGNKSWADI